jgi:site-specific recombinase XerD
MNAYLMEIGTIQGIEKKLTTHVARHTFAVLMLEKGLPLETVSHILGHSSTKITSIYARVLVSKIQNDYKRLDINSL